MYAFRFSWLSLNRVDLRFFTRLLHAVGAHARSAHTDDEWRGRRGEHQHALQCTSPRCCSPRRAPRRLPPRLPPRLVGYHHAAPTGYRLRVGLLCSEHAARLPQHVGSARLTRR